MLANDFDKYESLKKHLSVYHASNNLKHKSLITKRVFFGLKKTGEHES